MQSRSLAKVLAVLALGVGALGATTAARADGRVSLHIGVGVPLGAPVYVQPAPQPVYVQPQPIYSQPQVVYTQPQVVYTQPQVVYSQPQVIYAPAPVYYQRPPVVVGPVFRAGFYGGGGHGHGHGHGYGHRGHWR